MKTRTIRQADRAPGRADAARTKGKPRGRGVKPVALIESRAAASVGTLEMVIGACGRGGYELFCTDWFMPTDGESGQPSR